MTSDTRHLVFSVLLALGLSHYLIVAEARVKKVQKKAGRRYFAPYAPLLFWWILLIYMLLGLRAGSLAAISGPYSAWLFTELLLTGIYYLPVWFILKRFGNSLSPGSRALLWLLPLCNYVFCWIPMQLTSPLLIIPVRGKWVKYALYLWLLISLVLFLKKLILHSRFKNRLEADCRNVRDEHVLALWEEEQAAAKVKRNTIDLYTHPMLCSPMSVGIRHPYVVIPQREYSDEELRILFRHELVHIGRRDCAAKCSLALFTSLGWYNPLMRKLSGEAAESIECACDASVIGSFEEDIRDRYAELILVSSDMSEGFTSCLSQSAGALRRRLKAITQPEKKRSGIGLVFLLAFLLFVSTGTVALAVDENDTRLFRNSAAGSENLPHIEVMNIYHIEAYTGKEEILFSRDPDRILQLLEDTERFGFAGTYTLGTRGLAKKNTAGLLVFEGYGTNGNYARFVLQEDILAVVPKKGGVRYYYVPGVDREGIMALLEPVPIEPEDLSDRLPELQITLNPGSPAYERVIIPELTLEKVFHNRSPFPMQTGKNYIPNNLSDLNHKVS